MPAPMPLTQCNPPKLDWSRPGTPAATDFGDIYFSTDGGLEETHAVFLQGCGLPEGWQNSQRYVIGELGFGSGLNFLATWRLWDSTKTPHSCLHFVSIEKFPFNKDQLEKALSAWPELKFYVDQLISVWPGRVKGFHRLHFGDVTLTLIHDDVDALDELDASIDAWFLDGFSPAKNPEMWSTAIMRKLAGLSTAGTRLATFTVAGAVRSALKDAGFETEKKEGFGRKRHRLEAYYPGISKEVKFDIAPAIVGAGIAGASLVKAFARRGITPLVYHVLNHEAASHNPAAIIKPRLDLQDRPESRFFLSSYLYALNAYREYAVSQGIKHIAKTDAEQVRFLKLIKQAPLPDTHLTMTDNTLFFRRSLTINPKIVLADWLNIELLEGNEWHDHSLAILAAGYGIKELLKAQSTALRYSRGQLTWAKPHDGLKFPMTYGGYALPLEEGILLGVTHDRVGSFDPFTSIKEHDFKNIEKCESNDTRHITISDPAA